MKKKRAASVNNSCLVSVRLVQTLAYILLCSAYIQGPLDKIFNFPMALEEMRHFNLLPASLFAVTVIIFELTCSAAIIIGWCRWQAALLLAGFTVLATFLALPFWSQPEALSRMAMRNGFFEHLGLIGGLLLVAWYDFFPRQSLTKRDSSPP